MTSPISDALVGACSRRRLLQAGAAFATTTAFSHGARAQQTYPWRPLRIVVPWAPGGLVDTGGRVIGDALARAFGVGAPVENVPGAAGTLGADLVAKSTPDGHVLLMGTSSLAIDVAGNRKMAFQPLKDLAPVALVADTYSVVVVPQASPIQSLQQLVAAARAKPGSFSYGTPGIGSPAHLFTELLAQTAKLDLLHVPYGRTAAINDLLGGRLSMMVSTVPSALPQIRNKLLRALAVTGTRRIATLPDVPTVAETGVGDYEASQWLGVFVAAGTPRETIARLHREISTALAQPETVQTLSARGLEPRSGDPEEFSRVFAADVEKWSRVMRAGNIHLE